MKSSIRAGASRTAHCTIPAHYLQIPFSYKARQSIIRPMQSPRLIPLLMRTYTMHFSHPVTVNQRARAIASPGTATGSHFECDLTRAVYELSNTVVFRIGFLGDKNRFVICVFIYMIYFEFFLIVSFFCYYIGIRCLTAALSTANDTYLSTAMHTYACGNKVAVLSVEILFSMTIHILYPASVFSTQGAGSKLKRAFNVQASFSKYFQTSKPKVLIINS